MQNPCKLEGVLKIALGELGGLLQTLTGNTHALVL